MTERRALKFNLRDAGGSWNGDGGAGRYREIEGSYSRASDLRSIVEAMVEHGMVMEALAVAREIEAPCSRALALRSIVEALGKVGLAKEAREAEVEAREAAIEALADAREEEPVFPRAVSEFNRRRSDESRNDNGSA